MTREWTGTVSTQTTVVQHQNGKLIMKEAEQRERQAEYFCTVLNRPDLETSAPSQGSNRITEMKKAPISCQETEEVITQAKENTAPI